MSSQEMVNESESAAEQISEGASGAGRGRQKPIRIEPPDERAALALEFVGVSKDVEHMKKAIDAICDRLGVIPKP